MSEYKVPCGRTTGHGECCAKGYLCDACQEIVKLRGPEKEKWTPPTIGEAFEPCARKDCFHPAYATPVMRVWTMPFQADRKSANFHFANWPTCKEHIVETKVDAFLTKENMKMIDEFFEKKGSPLPNWQTARLDWLPLQGQVIRINPPKPAPEPQAPEAPAEENQ